MASFGLSRQRSKSPDKRGDNWSIITNDGDSDASRSHSDVEGIRKNSALPDLKEMKQHAIERAQLRGNASSWSKMVDEDSNIMVSFRLFQICHGGLVLFCQ